MLGAPLSYQELSDYLCGVTSSLFEDELPRLISTLHYYQDRFSDLTPVIESLNDDRPRRAFRKPASWVTLPKKKRKTVALDELRRREGSSYEAIAALHTLLSPIRRLPSELLTEIFIHCLPRDQFVQPNDAGSPLRLMQVCTQWWQVCMSSPELWTSIDLMPPTMATTPLISCNDSQSISIAKTVLLDIWISRSGDLPLSLSIYNGLLALESIQRLMMTCARRLQHLKVLIPEKDCCLVPDCDYPLLTSLDIHSPRGLRHASVNDLSATMTRAPTLRQFTWRSITSHVFRPPPVAFHWPNLHHLTLHSTVTIDHCLNILSMATNATHLEFKDIFALSSATHYPNITLLHLSTLIIGSHHDISRIFNALTLPHLTHLTVTNPSWHRESIVGFFRRSCFPLQGLVFFAPLSESDLIECLEVVHNTLTELTVQTLAWTVVTDVLLGRLTVAPEGSVLCPRLEALAFYDCISCSPGFMALMVRSRFPSELGKQKETETVGARAPPVSPMRSVELYASDPELSPLKPLRSLGLKLLVYSADDMSLVDLD